MDKIYQSERRQTSSKMNQTEVGKEYLNIGLSTEKKNSSKMVHQCRTAIWQTRFSYT